MDYDRKLEASDSFKQRCNSKKGDNMYIDTVTHTKAALETEAKKPGKIMPIHDLAVSYIEKMRDNSIPYDNRYLKKLLKNEKPKMRQKVKKYLHIEAKNELLPQLETHSKEIYLAMMRSGKWGVFGEQRISISFCRNLLKIPPNRQVFDFHINRMDQIIDSLDYELGYKSGEELIQHCIDRPIVLFGKTYSNFGNLENFIALLEAPYYYGKQ